MSDHHRPSPLRTFLEKKGGAASWRDWMEAALYDPDNGYYTANIRTVGRTGDFSTSATLGKELGTAIAAWVKKEWERAGQKLPLIEIGPGDGSLHDQVMRALGMTGRWRLRSHLVERSPVLRGRQQTSLKRCRHCLTWHECLESALERCGGRALIFSNELADAFPANLFQRDAGGWKEVWLSAAENGGIVETLRPRPVQVRSSAFDIECQDGQRVEVLHSWREWLQKWVRHWKAGAMLTIDYGGTPAEIYHRRPGGTVRGYFHHQRLAPTELYPLMGRCDITVDVNFTDLIEWGEAAGLSAEQMVTQRVFVQSKSSGPLQREGGAADAFRCLIQRPPPVC
ncbi:MAG TPA: SAM-dependent methyltransferase [Verrucomicrobiales bacterium]|jgi:SAM-dependent MidA family methyltransferase|nr:SAM-dependent methyltransferase [Verrucomicrobiales bacterium]